MKSLSKEERRRGGGGCSGREETDGEGGGGRETKRCSERSMAGKCEDKDVLGNA